MNAYHELAQQNLLDGWAMTYMDLTDSIMKTLGRSGEGIIREAVRRYGSDCGLQYQTLCLAHNIKTNLDTLFSPENHDWFDPRFRYQLQRCEEECFINEVITCPIADFWALNGGKEHGRWFCEEFYHAMASAYCYNISQTNISDTLTHDGDNHCRFAIYMRAACLEKEKRPQSYARFDPDGPKPSPLPRPSPKQRLEYNSLLLYYKLLEVGVERFQDEGRCALALGLRALGQDAAAYIKRRAQNTGNPPDLGYAEANFPIGPQSEHSVFWDTHPDHEAKELLSVNMLRILKEELAG